MLTLPTDWLEELEGVRGGLQALVVYELELDAGTVYLGSQSVTWGGNDYTPLAVRQSPIIEEMGRRVPEIWVEFSNVERVLASYVEPTDLITGRRITVRLLLWTSSGLSSDSVVLHKGVMERPSRVDESTFRISSVGILRGSVGEIPGRTLSEFCGVHEFADGEECNYVQSAVTVGAYSGTTIEVDDVQPFADEIARLSSGATPPITVGSNAVNLTGTLTSPDRITVDSSISGGDAEAVVFIVCDRSPSACDARGRRHEIQAFLGKDATKQIVLHPNIYAPGNDGTSGVSDSGQSTIGVSLSDERLADPHAVVPILYGRRWILGRVIEAVHLLIRDNSGAGLVEVSKQQAITYLISEGPIDEVVDWLVNGAPASDSEQDGAAGTPGSGHTYPDIGLFWRRGTIGETGMVDYSYYEDVGLATVDLVTRFTDRELPQKADKIVSVAQDAMSFAAYAVMFTREDADRPEAFDVKGRQIWRYTNASTPTHDPADGPAIVFSRNPIWQAVDAAITKRYGAGRLLVEADHDFTVIQPAAEACDAPRTDGFVATVTNAGYYGALANQYVVDDASNFEAGQTVIYDGTNYTDEEDVIEKIFYVGPVGPVIILATSRPNMVNGDTITHQPETYTSDIVIDRSSRPDEAIREILRSCLGYITYSAEGKIQYRVEREESDSGIHYKDTGAATGYGIVKSSFRWLTDGDVRDRRINRVFGIYQRRQFNESRPVRAVDDADVAANGPNTLTVQLPGVSSKIQAQRLVEIELAKRRSLGSGAEFVVGPVGNQHQPGDRIKVTHAVPGWDAANKRIIRVERLGLGDANDLMVKLAVEDYNESVYSLLPPPAESIPQIDEFPSVLLTIYGSTQSKVDLLWNFQWSGSSTANISVASWEVYKSAATMGGVIDKSKQVYSSKSGPPPGGGSAAGHKYTYSAADSEIGQTLYFMVVVNVADGQSIISNEISPLIGDTSPTATQFTPGSNLVAGGLFRDGDGWVGEDPSYGDGGTPNDDDHDSGTWPDGTWTNPGNAHDASESSYADVTCSNFAEKEFRCFWTAPGIPSGYGRFRVLMSVEGVGSVECYVSEDSGSNYILYRTVFPTGALGNPQWFTFPRMFGASGAIEHSIRFVARSNHATDDLSSRIYDVHYDVDPGEGSEVSGNCLLIGGTTEIVRPFPGISGGGINWKTSQNFVVSAYAALPFSDSDPGGSVTIALRKGSTDVDVWTRDSSDLFGGADGFYATLFTPSSDMLGQWDIVIKTSAIEAVCMRKLMITEGQNVYLFNTHVGEVGAEIEWPLGFPGPYDPTGAWTAVLYRRAQLVS